MVAAVVVATRTHKKPIIDWSTSLPSSHHHHHNHHHNHHHHYFEIPNIVLPRATQRSKTVQTCLNWEMEVGDTNINIIIINITIIIIINKLPIFTDHCPRFYPHLTISYWFLLGNICSRLAIIITSPWIHGIIYQKLHCHQITTKALYGSANPNYEQKDHSSYGFQAVRNLPWRCRLRCVLEVPGRKTQQVQLPPWPCLWLGESLSSFQSNCFTLHLLRCPVDVGGQTRCPNVRPIRSS